MIRDPKSPTYPDILARSNAQVQPQTQLITIEEDVYVYVEAVNQQTKRRILRLDGVAKAVGGDLKQ